MKSIAFPSSAFKFLTKIEKNNNREWFNKNKEQYTHEHAKVLQFVELVNAEMNKLDHLVDKSPKQTLYRIYRDIRFSKDKTPYKTNWSAGMSRETKWLRGGYYYSISPGGKTIVAGGFFSPNKEDLKRIRNEFAIDAKPMRKIMATKTFKNYFQTLSGKAVKTAPQGFSKEDPNIDLIRYKQLYVVRSFTDKEVLGDSFLKEVIKTFKAMRPYFNYMSDVLTTDLNGVPLH